MNIQTENFLNTTREGEVQPFGKVEFVFQIGMKSSKQKAFSTIVILRVDETWIAGWCATSPDKLDETWYNGVSWEDMLAAFRSGVAEKMKLGFVPEGQAPNMIV